MVKMEYAKRLRNAKIVGTPVLRAARSYDQLRIREKEYLELEGIPPKTETKSMSNRDGHEAPAHDTSHGDGHAAPGHEPHEEEHSSHSGHESSSHSGH